MDDWTNGDLFDAARGGDQAAWNEIVRRYERFVWFCIHQTGTHGPAAEDVFQTVWFRLVDHIDRIQNPNGITSWLRQTATRECWDVSKKSRRESPTEFLYDPIDPDPSPEDLALHTDDQARMVEAFRRLSDICHELLTLLFELPARSYDDISAITGIKRGTLGKRRRDCLADLRRLMEQS